MSHSDDLNALLVVDEPAIDLFDTVRIFEGSNGIRKIHAVLAKTFRGFATVSFVLHGHMIPNTGSGQQVAGDRAKRSVANSVARSGNERRARRAPAWMARPTNLEGCR
jgi:hypothetical protein